VTQFLFFSGKGGVGKTTMACTTAVAEADAGKRVLIVTTDPASNLADVFEQPIGHAVTAIAGVPGLWAMEIDPTRRRPSTPTARSPDPRDLPRADRRGHGGAARGLAGARQNRPAQPRVPRQQLNQFGGREAFDLPAPIALRADRETKQWQTTR
jgi:hypothetical protein